MIRNTFAVALLSLALVGCGGSRSQASSGTSEYTRQVQSYLARFAGVLETQGYRKVAAGPVFGSLDDDGKASHDMNVVGGVNYALFGACDNDCRDVDLIIYDSNGNVVKRDIAVDDNPLLLFTAARSAKYRIEVIMAVCNTEPCRYGLQLNSK